MDPLAQVALIGVVTTMITTIGAVVIAVINGRRERYGSAENSLERVLRERLSMKDETIAEQRLLIDELRRELGRVAGEDDE